MPLEIAEIEGAAPRKRIRLALCAKPVSFIWSLMKVVFGHGAVENLSKFTFNVVDVHGSAHGRARIAGCSSASSAPRHPIVGGGRATTTWMARSPDLRLVNGDGRLFAASRSCWRSSR